MQGVPDEMRSVTTEESYEMMRRAAREEGLILSPSAAANLTGAVKISRRVGRRYYRNSTC